MRYKSINNRVSSIYIFDINLTITVYSSSIFIEEKN